MTPERVASFAHLSGDDNPLHMNAEAARRYGFPARVAHGGILLAEISRIIGTELPGKGSLWMSSEIQFQAPVLVGTAVSIEATVAHVSTAVNVAIVEFRASRETDGAVVLAGSAKVMILEESMPLSYRPIHEQRVIVTGGTRGLGRIVTRTLLDAGATVLAVYREDAEAAASLEAERGGGAGTLHVARCDVRDSGAVAEMLAFAGEQLGSVDSFVHAASPALGDVPFEALDWSIMSAFLETYVKACIEIVQGCLPHFRGRGAGRVVLVGSEVVQAPRRSWTHYVTAKSAFIGLVRALAVELAEDQVTANLVSPGVLQGSADLSPNAKSMTRTATPLKRLVTEEEVGEVVAFLLGKGGSFITGANIPLTGGRVFLA
jgi:3-oxoacyl-[acyl-carrier protein] reductase